MDKSAEIRKLCQEKAIRMIDFKMTDIDGRWRHITIPVERFDENVFVYGIGFDGSNYGYAPVEKSDMVFLPDPDTAYVDPFAEVPTLTMCGNVCVIGKVQVTKGSLAVSLLEPGDLFGAAALYSGEAEFASTITAQRPSACLMLEQSLVDRLLAEQGQIRENYLRYLTGRIRFLSGRLQALAQPIFTPDRR